MEKIERTISADNGTRLSLRLHFQAEQFPEIYDRKHTYFDKHSTYIALHCSKNLLQNLRKYYHTERERKRNDTTTNRYSKQVSKRSWNYAMFYSWTRFTCWGLSRFPSFKARARWWSLYWTSAIYLPTSTNIWGQKSKQQGPLESDYSRGNHITLARQFQRQNIVSSTGKLQTLGENQLYTIAAHSNTMVRTTSHSHIWSAPWISSSLPIQKPACIGASRCL